MITSYILINHIYSLIYLISVVILEFLLSADIGLSDLENILPFLFLPSPIHCFGSTKCHWLLFLGSCFIGCYSSRLSTVSVPFLLCQEYKCDFYLGWRYLNKAGSGVQLSLDIQGELVPGPPTGTKNPWMLTSLT